MDWTAMAAPWLKWETGIEAAHRVMLDGLIARAAPQPGEAVLDIGCGSGASTLRALQAVGDSGQVLAVDIAPPLAARTAERVAGRARVEVGDAQHHGFEPGGFDLALSQFGLMFFADTVAAFGNIRRALRPGGRLHFVAWATPARNDWFAVSRRIAIARLGPVAPTDPLAPGPFAFADAERVLGMLRAAGWEAGVETVALEMRPAGAPEDVAAMQMSLGVSRVLAELEATDADRAAVAREVTQAFAGMRRDGQIRVPAEVHFFHAVTPG